MTFAHYDFTRGSSIHEHFHAEEEVYEVIEGELEVTIDGVVEIARAGRIGVAEKWLRSPAAFHAGPLNDLYPGFQALAACLPPHQGTAPCHPRADRHHRDKIARLETARPVRLVERNRQSGTRRIAVTFEVLDRQARLAYGDGV